MNSFSWRDWCFAIKAASAAILALGISFWIGLPRPYWAVATVYIVIQPLSGATAAKAIYRIYGTFLGATAAIILVPTLVNAPALLCLALALWVAVCLYFSLLDRTPRSYVLMLAGFTAAFVSFPLVNDPGSIFDFGVSRVEEIGLGIICASLVSTLVFPQSVVPMVRSRLDQWFHEAEDWITTVLDRTSKTDEGIRRLQLAGGVLAFDALITPLQHDMTDGERSADTLATLRQHMLMFLPIVTAIHDRIDALQKLNALPSVMRELLDNMATEARSPDASQIRNQRQALSRLARPSSNPPGWTDLVLATLVVRLGDYLDLRQDALMLRAHVANATPATERFAFQYTARARTVRHHDHLLALLSAMAAFIAILAASAFWIASSWPDGYAAPMLAAVGCSFFATQDDPVLPIQGFAKATLIAIVGSAVYLFAILPRAASFEMVAIALAPALVACGLLITRPRTAIIGLTVAVNGFTVIAIQNNYAGDFAAFVNSAIAVLVGTWTAALTTQLFRSVGAAWTARHLRRTNRDSLVQAATDHESSDSLELAALMLDRVGLVASRLAALPPEDIEWTAELLSEVRVGVDLVELKRAYSSLPALQAAEITKLFAAIGRHFRGNSLHATNEILSEIDICLGLFLPRQTDACWNMTLALTDLRRSLFPNAAPLAYPGGSDPSHSGLAA